MHIARSLAIVAAAVSLAGISACSVAADFSPRVVERAGYLDLGGFGLAAEKIDATFGLEPDFQDWEEVKEANCSEVAAGGSNYWAPNTARDLPTESAQEVALLAWAASITRGCPRELKSWEWAPEEEEAFARIEPGWRGWLTSGESVDSHLPSTPIPIPAAPPKVDDFSYEEWYDRWEQDAPTIPGGEGYAVYCEDGTISYSGGIQGACSWHGGVAD
jgi:hypothetical protein